MCKFCLRQKRIVAHFVRWKLIPIPFLVCSVHRQYRSSLLELSKFIKFVLWIDLWPSAGSKWSLSCEQLRILLLLRKSLCLSLTVVPWQACPRTTTFSSFITFFYDRTRKKENSVGQIWTLEWSEEVEEKSWNRGSVGIVHHQVNLLSSSGR